MTPERISQIEELAEDDWDQPWLGDEVDELIAEIRRLRTGIRLFGKGPFDFTSQGSKDGEPTAYIVPANRMEVLLALLGGTTND